MANYLIPGSESTLKHTYVLTIPTTWAVKDLSMETTWGYYVTIYYVCILYLKYTWAFLFYIQNRVVVASWNTKQPCQACNIRICM